MKISLTILMFLLTFAVKAQIINNYWYEGEVILNNKEIKKGELKVDFSKDLLYYRTDSVSFIFLPSAVNHFVFKDEDKNPRTFSPFQYNVTKKKERWAFFELYFIGKTTSILSLGEGIPASYELQIYPHLNYVKFTFYLKNHLGQLRKFKASNAHIIKLLEDEKIKIKDYIKTNSLDCGSFDDLVKVIEYYDHLKIMEAGL